MEINAARFLVTGNRLEIWQVDAQHWQFYSVGYQRNGFFIEHGGAPSPARPLSERHKTLAVALAQVGRQTAPMAFDWWRRSGPGDVIDIARFCQQGHRLVFWPNNWNRFSHISRISPLVFMGWQDGQFYVYASAIPLRYNIIFTSATAQPAMARAVRARLAREAILSGTTPHPPAAAGCCSGRPGRVRCARALQRP